jgi:hypothetical protein
MNEYEPQIIEYGCNDILPPLNRREFLQTIGGGIIILSWVTRTDVPGTPGPGAR